MDDITAVEIFKNTEVPWVLFIHAIGGSSRTWKKQTDAFAADYNLLLAELHGARGCEPLTMESVCAQLFELLNERGIKRVYIVSLCAGSLIALAFAALYPNMVGGMVMASGILAFDRMEKYGITLFQFLKKTTPFTLACHIMAWLIMPGKRHLKSRRIFIREAHKMGHNEFCRWVDFFPAMLDNGSYIAQLNSLKNTPHSLYVMGSGDKRFLPLTRQFIGRVNNARIEVLPGCGHICIMEQADLFNMTALNFIGTLTKRI